MGLSAIVMRKGFATSLGLLIIVLLLTCGKKNVTWVYYNETQCADAWTVTNNNEVLKDNVTEHFKSKGVRIYEIEIFVDGPPQTCSACSCLSGRVIKCKVKDKDVDAMLANGFHM